MEGGESKISNEQVDGKVTVAVSKPWGWHAAVGG